MAMSVALTCVCLLSVAFVSSAITETVQDYNQRFLSERECSMVGGQCLHKMACAADRVSSQGICPHQSQYGAVCCHGDSILETDCQRLQGECKPSCPSNLIKEQAQNCPPDQKCCVLV